MSDFKSNVPGFLSKLWSIVNDDSIPEIGWSEEGDTFIIYDRDQLANNVIPRYFKHNNLNSFIRQLNLYGFRKVSLAESNMKQMSMFSHSVFEFYHPQFMRDAKHLMKYIKRKVPEQSINSASSSPSLQVEIRELRDQQDALEIEVYRLNRDNKYLSRELAHLRQQQNHQQNYLNKMLSFLASKISVGEHTRRNHSSTVFTKSSRKRPKSHILHLLPATDSPDDTVYTSSSAPVIEEPVSPLPTQYSVNDSTPRVSEPFIINNLSKYFPTDVKSEVEVIAESPAEVPSYLTKGDNPHSYTAKVARTSPDPSKALVSQSKSYDIGNQSFDSFQELLNNGPVILDTSLVNDESSPFYMSKMQNQNTSLSCTLPILDPDNEQNPLHSPNAGEDLENMQIMGYNQNPSNTFFDELNFNNTSNEQPIQSPLDLEELLGKF